MKEFKPRTIENPQEMKSYWKAEYKCVLVILFTGILYNVGLELSPILQGKVIDLIVTGETTGQITGWIGLFILAVAFVQMNRFLKRYYVRVFANRTSMTMRNLVYSNMIQRDISLLKEESAGDLMTKAISDVGECVEGMRKFTTEIFDTGVLMLTYFVTMLYYSPKMTLICAVFIPIAMFIAERMKIVIYRYTKSYRAQLSKVSEVTLENIENELLYRMHGVEDLKSAAYKKELADLEKKAVKANMLENSMQPVYRFIALIGIVYVVTYGGQLVLSGVLTIGQFSAYLTIFTAFSLKVSKAAKLFNSVQKARVSWKRILPYLDQEKLSPKTEPVIQVQEEAVSGKTPQYTLEVRDLHFEIIEKADFSLKTGEIIGVTGPVASGKSAIGRALQGLYPYEGSIRICGEELRTMPHEKISSLVTYMGHDSQLLSDSIYQNVTLGKDGDISKVLAHVCFDQDLAAMEEGVHTLVGAQGVRLSGGQQSRLALARALYNRSGILVLDDPFAAVDVKTEQKILHNLRMYYSDLAILLISHRISSFDKAQGVLFVDQGRTVFGTHERLMEQTEGYRQLYRLQTGDAACEEASHV